jgi:hypothetical protein
LEFLPAAKAEYLDAARYYVFPDFQPQPRDRRSPSLVGVLVLIVLQRMNLSECGLRLHVTEVDGDLLLRFSTLTLGFEGYLCSIRKRSRMPLFDPWRDRTPDRFTRVIFRLFHGLHEFREECSLRSDACDREYIRFFRCSDRRGRSRSFICAAELPGSEAGGIFIADEGDFENVLRCLRKIEEKWTESKSLVASGDNALL